jgi:hypothetical protein
MRRRGWAQQILFDALTAAGDAGLTVREIAPLVYHEDTPMTRNQVQKLIERARHYSMHPLSIESRVAYRLRPAPTGPAAAEVGR